MISAVGLRPCLIDGLCLEDVPMGAKRCGRYGYDQTQAPHAPGTIIFRGNDGADCKSVGSDGGNGLRGVDSIREHDAWAVGDAAGRTRARQWDGTSWNAVPLPNVVAGKQMAVSAALRATCGRSATGSRARGRAGP